MRDHRFGLEIYLRSVVPYKSPHNNILRGSFPRRPPLDTPTPGLSLPSSVRAVV
jgi:hypothetical protein